MMTNKQASDAQEKLIAEFLGWSQVPGSGARPTHCGDVQSTLWLGECKTHVTPGHKIHFDSKVWSKIVDEAASTFKKAAYFVDDGSQTIDRTFVVFSGTFSDALSSGLTGDTLNFDHSDLRRDCVYRLKLGRTWVSLAHLTKFKEVLWTC